MIRKQSLQTHRELGDATGVSHQRVHQASTVIDNAPELADQVMAGTVQLNEAYAEARQRKEATENREEQAGRAERDLGRVAA